ncbi:hypothetical protein [Bauldia litoralis]|uniref:hypothetical protein n=1 Tax=Bauldia litoralis TaxID=665467 RepID=UPI003265EC95
MAGITPKDFLLNGLAFYHGQITDEQAKKEPDEGKIAAAFSAGKEFAKDAAPYCHSRYGTIEGDRRAPQQQEPAPTDARAPTGDSNVDEIVTRFNTALKPAANGAVKH